MALIQATSSFDIDNINLYRTTSLSTHWIFPSSGNPVYFQDNGMQSYGYWFDDALQVLYDYAGSSYELALGGNGLTWNGTNLTGGTVVAMIELSLDSSGVTQTVWTARDFSLAATSFSAARLSSSNTDDYTLIQAILSGSDQILGSASSDRFRGYGGSDSIDGAGGSDTAIYSGKFSDYSFAFNKSTLATTITDLVAGRDGVDSLQNIESLQFSDVTVNLTSYQSDATGPYAVTYSPVGGASNVAVSSDFVITFNEPILRGTGSITLINTATGATVYTIAASSSELTFSGNTLTINPAMDLSAGTSFSVLASSDFVRDIATNSSTPGSSYLFSTKGPIVYEAESNSSIAQANIVPAGSIASGQLSSYTDVDYFSVAAGSSSLVTINFTEPVNNYYNYLIKAYNSAGTLLAGWSTSSDATYQFSAPSSGSYYIAVSGDGSYTNTGQYELALNATASNVINYESEANNTIATADSVIISTPIVGQLSSYTDVDYFSVATASPAQITINFTEPVNNYYNYLIKAYNSSGTLLAGWSTSSDATYQFSAPSSGSYYIAVSGDGSYTNTGQYSVTLNAPINIRFDAVSGSIIEGNAGSQVVNLTASLSNASSTAVSVPITYSGTATSGSDYTGAPTSITILAGSTTGSASFSVVGDTAVESNEIVVLTMGTPTGATLGANYTYTQTIVDNDTIPPTVSFNSSSASIGEGNSGSQVITVNASLNYASNLAIEIPITYSGTATSGSDYTGAQSSISIPAGSTTGSASFSVVGDTAVELNETVVLTMGSAPNVSLGLNNSYTQVITNDDFPSASMLWSGTSVTEGDSGSKSVAIAVRLTDAVSSDMTFPIAVSGTATSGIDYSGVPEFITVVAGNTEANASFNVFGDTVAEPNESIIFTLGTPTGGYTLGPQSNLNATYTILNDDLPTLSFVETSSIAYEGNSGTKSYAVTVQLSAPALVDTEVGTEFMSSSTSTPYTDRSWSTSPWPIIILAGQTTATATFDVYGDTTVEPSETFIISLRTIDYLGPLYRLGANTVFTHSIANDDGVPSVSFATTSGSASEGNINNLITVNASLSRTSTSAVTVPITYSGTATSGADYINAPASITIAAGSTTGSASFSVVGDTSIESNETIVMAMGVATNATLGSNATFTQTIVNDDVALPTVSFTSTTASINEGNSGTLNVTVNASLSSAATTAVTVPITYSGTATAGTDYTGAPASITIAAGSTTGSASFNVVGDTAVESNETVVLTMGTPTGATSGTNTTFTETIVNDDVPTVSFTTTTASINEGNSGTQTVTATANLSSAATTAVTVPITVSGTATAGTDYTGAPSSITIAAGSTTGSASFNVLGDATVESGETVVLTMGNPTGAALGANTSFTQTIVNDDVAIKSSYNSPESQWLNLSGNVLVLRQDSGAIATTNGTGFGWGPSSNGYGMGYAQHGGIGTAYSQYLLLDRSQFDAVSQSIFVDAGITTFTDFVKAAEFLFNQDINNDGSIPSSILSANQANIYEGGGRGWLGSLLHGPSSPCSAVVADYLYYRNDQCCC